MCRQASDRACGASPHSRPSRPRRDQAHGSRAYRCATASRTKRTGSALANEGTRYGRGRAQPARSRAVRRLFWNPEVGGRAPGSADLRPGTRRGVGQRPSPSPDSQLRSPLRRSSSGAAPASGPSPTGPASVTANAACRAPRAMTSNRFTSLFGMRRVPKRPRTDSSSSDARTSSRVPLHTGTAPQRPACQPLRGAGPCQCRQTLGLH